MPDAYLPTITWAGWLFSALRWLLIPAALLMLLTSQDPALFECMLETFRPVK